MNDLQTIAKDLELCGLINAFGDKAAKRKATAHRKACFHAIAVIAPVDQAIESLNDDELLEALGL